jgi:Mg2+ and Co2+ transporter CorA
MPMVDDFDRAINDLEERVFHMKKGSKTILEDIMDLRRSVARLRRISARQLDVFYRMSHGEFPQIPANILLSFAMSTIICSGSQIWQRIIVISLAVCSTSISR